MAAHSKKARKRKATIVFADETAFMMLPLLRRTWAPRGKTPVLMHVTRSYRKVSAMGAVALSPRARRVRLMFRLLPDANFDADQCVAFLRQLKQNTKGPVILVWDRLRAHRSRKVERFVRGQRRLEIELLPPYAPELNPTEYVWAYLKGSALANLAPHDQDRLQRQTKRSLCELRRHKTLIKSIIRRCPLPIGT